ncbi:MAG: phospholipase D-like domain-containing protein, partial [Bacteroidota bacterium]
MNITNEAYFSPSDLPQKKIIEYLHKAQQQLCICVFTISDNMITEAIVQCARKGIPVQIVTDNDKTFDKGSDIWVLAKEGGIEIKVDMTDNHMHHKF